MNPNRARILVVDDSPLIRKVICRLMQHLGFVSIDEASDGASALELFRTTPYDLVLTDWGMPLVSGVELLQTIRKGSVRCDTPVVIFTGEVSSTRMVEAIEAGANAFVPKPFHAGAVSEKVLSIVNALPARADPGRRPPEAQRPHL